MQLLIAETGEAAGDLPQRFGYYGEMMQRMLAGAGLDFQAEVRRVHDGDTIPTPDEADAMIVMGSPAGVYEDHDWIAPLEKAVREFTDAGRPVLGICFGHQLMAQAFGGRVEKSHHGWGVGVHTYEPVGDVWPFGTPHRFACAVSHQDQVVDIPAGVTRLAGSPFCPNGVLQYAGGKGLSFQMHPEFEHEFATALLRSRVDRMPEEVSSLGLASLQRPSDRQIIAGWIARFLKGESE